ncbi:hypothetical protein VHEMI07051 [[Torrubiella] hemipterigena]|uniref:Heterokaryon incompatibility domain-containing protein n=1 Tax=[Torrubiella] hemipterigena TaxID=1531966 RepID=A0A0A1TM69_9HYPO|nr:hypothetical protein VHEMI07051 [[Torrubiella] hemipterigena]
MLSPNPIVKCGAQEVSFDNFVVLRNLHWHFQMAELDRFRSLRNVWIDCPFAPLMWPNWKDWVGETLQSWLMDMASFQCSRPRDKVYALVGLTSRQSRGQITVEYDEGVMSDRAVFLEATQVCFREVGLLPLQQGQVDKVNSLQLPSWCPDWGSRAVCVPFVGFGFCPFPTTGSFHPPDDSWSSWKDKTNKPVLEFSDDGETLLTHGFIVDIVDYVDEVGTLETPEVPVYTGTDEQGRENARKKRLETTKKACLRWEKHLHSVQETGSPNFANDYQEAFCRTLIANRNFNKEEAEWNTKHIFDTWVGREHSHDSQLVSESVRQEDVQDYSNCVVSRCAKRTFITTVNGRFGLAPQKAEKGDLVCIFYGGEVPCILRNQQAGFKETLKSFIGEAYIHGIMQGEYIQTAESDEFTSFRLI